MGSETNLKLFEDITQKKKKKKKRTQKERMSNMGYKIIARPCQEGSDRDTKEGIILLVSHHGTSDREVVGQRDHATAYRTDTWDECGFSGWREIYEHTKSSSKQSKEVQKKRSKKTQKNYEKVWLQKYEQPDEKR